MKKLLFAIALGAIIVVGCKKEQEASQQPVLQTVTLRASGEAFDGVNLDGTTKGTMDTDGTFRWAAGDMIGVRLYKGEAYVGNDSGSGYNAWDGGFLLEDDSAGNPSGVFTCTTSLDQYVHWGYAAFYPKFDNNINNGDGKVYFELKKTYDNYTSGSCLMPMVANLNDPDNGGLNGRPSEMKLKHVGAGVRVTLKDVPGAANQASLTVTGKNIVNGTENTAWYGVNPANAGTDFISATDGSENTVYLKFATASEKRDITFIFPLPTVDLNGGIELKLYYNDGTDEHKEFWSRKASTLPALTRGQLLDMPDVTVPVTPEESLAPIWIDGKIKDWANVSHITSTSSNRILEWKYTQDDNNLYFLYKIDASKIGADESGSYKWGSYIYIGFDTDNDATKGKSGSGGLGDGMEYRAVVFPWRGTTATGLECFVGVDDASHIDDLFNEGEAPTAKVGSKIDGSYSYVEVRIPRSAIGNPTGPITVKHAMNYYPTDAKQILPELVTIVASDQTVDVGKTVEIGATANTTQAISYVSNDENIATVDANGVITGIAAGSTTITLNVAAVAGEYSAATKTINVEVTTPYVPAIVINGDFSDWTGITEYAGTRPGGVANTRINAWRMTSDTRNMYFYLELNTEKITTSRYIYVGFDTDRDESQGSTIGNIPGCEKYVKVYPTEEGSDPITFIHGADPRSSINSSTDGKDRTIQIWSVYGNPSTSTFVELCIPRSKVELSSAGSVDVAVTYDSYNTVKQTLVLN